MKRAPRARRGIDLDPARRRCSFWIALIPPVLYNPISLTPCTPTDVIFKSPTRIYIGLFASHSIAFYRVLYLLRPLDSELFVGKNEEKQRGRKDDTLSNARVNYRSGGRLLGKETRVEARSSHLSILGKVC